MTARILVVDDVPANTRLLEAKLGAEYYQVATAHSGYDAIGLAQTWQPDLILLDVMMPEIDGYETCRRLKEDGRTLHIPVVMVTALSEPEERLRGLEAGADDFLTKPVDYDTLLARTKSLVRLKRLLDEWRVRGETARALGIGGDNLPPPSVSGARALVVDDFEPSTIGMQDALAHEGILAARATSEAEALQLAGAMDFDLIVLSLSLTNDDPLRLAARLRAAERTQNVPLLLVADPEQKDRLRADLGHALEMALTDPLTGFYNQRYLMRHLRGLLASGDPHRLAVMMIDVDHFKSINDRWGHPIGDQALRMIADSLRRRIRVFDSIARYGGEEFAAVMPGTTPEDALAAAERLRSAIADMQFFPEPGLRHPLTVSIGISCGRHAGTTPERLLQEADQALYQAKREGRNRTVVFQAAGAA